MDLDEIKATWTQMSEQLEQQKKLTDKIILEMTQQKYRNKFRKINTFETIGAVFSYAISIYILININELDTWYLLTSGIITLGCLLVLPVLVLRSLKKLQGVDLMHSTYKETFIKFSKAKDHVLFLQRLAIFCGFLILFTSMPVFSKIQNGKDLFIGTKTWLWYIPVMSAVLFFFARWVYGYYSSITKSAETILNDLDQ